jgi:hypothetical protein
VARPGRGGDPARDEGGLPPCPDRPLRAGARRRAARLQEAELDFRYPDDGRPARLAAADARPRAADRRGGARIAAAEKPVLYVGGGTLNADACAELLELAEAAGCRWSRR